MRPCCVVGSAKASLNPYSNGTMYLIVLTTGCSDPVIAVLILILMEQCI